MNELNEMVGAGDLKKVFDKLDIKSKAELGKFSEIKRNKLLRIIDELQLIELYKSLDTETQQKLKKLNVWDKYFELTKIHYEQNDEYLAKEYVASQTDSTTNANADKNEKEKEIDFGIGKNGVDEAKNKKMNEMFRQLDRETRENIAKDTKRNHIMRELFNVRDVYFTHIKEVNDKYKQKHKQRYVQNAALKKFGETQGIEEFSFYDKIMNIIMLLRAISPEKNNVQQETWLQKEKKEKDFVVQEEDVEVPQVDMVYPEQTEEDPEDDLDREEAEEDVQEALQKAVSPEQMKIVQTKNNAEFTQLVQSYYESLYANSLNRYNELEVRFGTKGVKQLTKNDYDNVIKVLKSFGFTTVNSSGLYSLRIKCEFLDSKTGKFKMSNIRTEINGLHAIEKYCKTDDIKTIYKEEPKSVSFTHKIPFFTPDKRKVNPVNFNDFNFRVSLQTEERIKKGVEHFILENWRKSKKEFRYLNRVTLTHPAYPVMVDISITKTGIKKRDHRGFMNIVPVYTLDESNLFNNPESYEIEIEVNNKQIGPGTKYQSVEDIMLALRKTIKHVLSGIQGTVYPISYVEQNEVLRDYMKMIWKDDHDPQKKITTQHFIGPNSITLQLTNIGEIDENSNIPNVRKGFVVTDKADGDRHLFYISKTGKIYLIDTNMNVKFTGAKVTNEELFNTLLDGELISNDKNGDFINLYAAFDVYYYQNEDVRSFPFLKVKDKDGKDVEKNKDKSRYALLHKIKGELKPVSIINSATMISPIHIEVKKFYPMSPSQSIFEGCKTVLEKEEQGLFEYTIDGLIFTHMYYGVGSHDVGKAGPKTKVTWEYSFKWKPPKYNTIDFLVTTMKGTNGEDMVHSLFEDGMSTNYVQHAEYKVVELRCGFNERVDGFINPCQDIIDDNLPEYKDRFEDKGGNEYLPKRFYPTEPYDPNAGICKLMLKTDDSGAKQMFTESGDVILDNTIVEFAYDIDAKDGWNWKPLRVRYDKTSKLLRGEREFGNSYKVCNENWKSIHPSGRITSEMLMTGMNIPEVLVSEDVYYNTPAGKIQTEAMKNFHNLYVKKKLIMGVAKPGDTLIDFACGKAGDLSKWVSAKLSFVFGIDYASDNLENRVDGACARYLTFKKRTRVMPGALFVHGNSSFNIKDGTGLLNDKAKQITNAVFGNGPKNAEKLGKGVAKHYGKGESGFHISSCQFAIHYFFETPDTLKGFMRNVAECTKLNGYFIGTCYDGKIIFNELKQVNTGESVQINENGKKIWEIIKGYGSDMFEDNSSSIGYVINVFQESINQYITEYLVNFAYLERVMEAYGFKLITREEASEMGLPDGSGMFSELFAHMMDFIKKHKSSSSDFGDAEKMSSSEKKISFLNRYFVFKKLREVNIDKIQLDLGEYNEAKVQREKEDSEHSEFVAKQEIELEHVTEKKKKPRVKRLSNKIELIPATEAIEQKQETLMVEEPKIAKVKKTRGPNKKAAAKAADDEKDKASDEDKEEKQPKAEPATKTKRVVKKRVKLVIEEDN
jgi:hypothetical protein